MKVLFLDVDGVLNYSKTRERFGYYVGIDANKVTLLKAITNAVEALRIVLSSTWRMDDKRKNNVIEHVGELFGITPILHIERGLEIKMWLLDHPEVEKYAILDYDDQMTTEQQEHFFQTSWDEGLTQDIAEQVIDYFNG